MADVAIVPASYAARLAALLATRGFSVEQTLAGSGVTVDQLADPSARVSFQTMSDVFARALELSGDPSIGLELGLGLKASSHGMLGVALLTCNSVRDAVTLGGRFMDLRGSPWRVELFTDEHEQGERAIMRFVEVAVLPMRTLMLECVLGTVIRIGEFMTGESFASPAIEFWSDGPELPHHARFRDQIPRVRYDAPAIQAMFPTSWLDRPLALREAIAHREAIQALDRERRITGQRNASDDLLERARSLLADPEHAFPGLEQVASALSVSARTLRRHLSQRGVTFNALRDSARRTHATQLLEGSPLTIAEIARELGFSDAAGFVRAFQRWTGEPPSAYRKRAL
jgi:AraC-like DNA-binding protein